MQLKSLPDYKLQSLIGWNTNQASDVW